MSKTTKVDNFIENWDLPKKPEVETLRKIILEADDSINEDIRWNAPSFFVHDHFATFKPRPLETVQIVFHTGAKVKETRAAIVIDDPGGILYWVTKDRCVATFQDMAQIESNREAIADIVRQWVKQL